LTELKPDISCHYHNFAKIADISRVSQLIKKSQIAPNLKKSIQSAAAGLWFRMNGMRKTESLF